MRGTKAKRLRRLAYEITPRDLRKGGQITVKGTVFNTGVRRTYQLLKQGKKLYR